MKIQLSLLFFLIFFIKFDAQQYVFGNVSSESGEVVSRAEIVNIRSGQKYLTDHSGNFMMDVREKDEIRIAKEGFERQIVHLESANFSKPVNIVLVKSEILIEEVNLVYKPTGNLNQDIKHYGDSRKTIALNTDIRNYLKTEIPEVQPSLSIPSSFAPKDFSAGQINFLGVAGAIFKTIKKSSQPKISTPNYSERQAFINFLKSNINLDYYRNYGLDEFQIEQFLVYADNKGDLSKNFRKNFNKTEVEFQLKMAFTEFLKIKR